MHTRHTQDTTEHDDTESPLTARDGCMLLSINDMEAPSPTAGGAVGDSAPLPASWPRDAINDWLRNIAGVMRPLSRPLPGGDVAPNDTKRCIASFAAGECCICSATPRCDDAKPSTCISLRRNDEPSSRP